MGGGKNKRATAAKAPKAPKPKPAREPGKPKQKRSYVKHAAPGYKQAYHFRGDPVIISYK